MEIYGEYMEIYFESMGIWDIYGIFLITRWYIITTIIYLTNLAKPNHQIYDQILCPKLDNSGFGVLNEQLLVDQQNMRQLETTTRDGWKWPFSSGNLRIHHLGLPYGFSKKYQWFTLVSKMLQPPVVHLFFSDALFQCVPAGNTANRSPHGAVIFWPDLSAHHLIRGWVKSL